jgi:nucleoid-associated protein YgaU
VVRIAKDRLAVMAGRGPAGSKITLLDGKKPVAEAAADARGEWAVVVEKPMAGGAKELRLSAELADGRKVESEAPVLVLLPEDKDKTAKRPSAGAPTVVRLAAAKGESSRVLQRPTPSPTAAEKDADRLSLDAIDYDDDGKVIISGSAPDGAAVRAYLDNRPIGTAVASAERTWRLVPERAVAAGDYKLRLDHLGPDGHVLARLEVPFTRVEARLARRFSPGDRIVVQPGNNLWNIARHTYGRGILYSVIYERNSDQIRDPDLIYPGQIFSLPKITG